MQKMRLGQAILSGAVALCFYTVPALAAVPADTNYAEEAIEAGSNTPIPEAVVAVTAKTAAGTAAATADTASTAANTAKAVTAADSKTKPTASSAKKAAVTPKPAELPLPSLPNPIQEFSSLADLTSALGFSPLALPENSTFTATAFLKIDATLADIRYTAPAEKDGTAAQTLCLRSAKRTDWTETDISGIYGVNWWPYFISRTNVFVAQLPDGSYAARWSNAHYLFAMQAATDGDQALQLLSALINTTEASYTY